MRGDALVGLGQHYHQRGHVLLPGLVDPANAEFLVGQFISAAHADNNIVRQPPEDSGAVLGPALQIFSYRCPVLATFHLGLTPIVAAVTGLDLAPSFALFRVNTRRTGLSVHRDRPASEHGLSLALAYSDHVPWPLEIGTEPADDQFRSRREWGDLPHTSFSMGVGDGLLYRGPRYAHARTSPNPNDMSAHVFLFWVERNGPHADWSFDRCRGPGSEHEAAGPRSSVKKGARED